ncbi:hypothetical protein ACXYMU_06890 [Pontibacter sp. CAU 1760]
MLRKTTYTLLALAMPLLFACNTDSSQETEQPDAAYTSYQEMVTDFLNDDSLSETRYRAMTGSDLDSAEWAKLKAAREQEYQLKSEQVRKNLSQYTPAQQQEFETMESRYKQEVASQDKAYAEASHRYKLRERLLGLEIKQDDMSTIAAGELANTYKRFVDGVAGSAEQFETRDWNLVEGWWSALGSRFNSLEADLTAQAKREVAQAQQRYQQIRKQYAVQ